MQPFPAEFYLRVSSDAGFVEAGSHHGSFGPSFFSFNQYPKRLLLIIGFARQLFFPHL